MDFTASSSSFYKPCFKTFGWRIDNLNILFIFSIQWKESKCIKSHLWLTLIWAALMCKILNIRIYNKCIYWRSCWKKYLKLSIPKTLQCLILVKFHIKGFFNTLKALSKLEKKLKKIIWKLRRLEKLKKLPRFDSNYWDWKFREPWATKDIVF